MKTGQEGLVPHELSVTSGGGWGRKPYWIHPNPDNSHKMKFRSLFMVRCRWCLENRSKIVCQDSIREEEQNEKVSENTNGKGER